MNEEFEKQKICFEQSSLHAMNLAGIVSRMQVIAITLTGGFWHGAGFEQAIDLRIRFALPEFATCSLFPSFFEFEMLSNPILTR